MEQAPWNEGTLKVLYDLLNIQERILLGRLSVFVGGWTLPAAEFVGTGAGRDGESIECAEVLALLNKLVKRSLVVAERKGRDKRYHLPETVRKFAQGRLARGETETVRQKHRDYFLALAEETRPKLDGPEKASCLAMLETQHDNLQQAMRFCLQKQDPNVQAGLRLGAALWRFWLACGHLSEAREQLDALLARPSSRDFQQVRVELLSGAGTLAWMQADYASARALGEESLAIYRELGNKPEIVRILGNLGIAASGQNDLAKARSLHEEALALQRELADKKSIATSLDRLGTIASRQGDRIAARSHWEESLKIWQELGLEQNISTCLENLAKVGVEW